MVTQVPARNHNALRASPGRLILAILATLALLFAVFGFARPLIPPVLGQADKSECVQYDGFEADGDISEWDTSAGAECATLFEAGDPQKEKLARLFIGYDCTDAEVCFLILAEGDNTLTDDEGEIFVDIDLDGDGQLTQATERIHCNDLLVDCEFVFDANDEIIGVELCFLLPEGTYEIFDVHAEFSGDGGRTGRIPEAQGFEITVGCGSLLILKTDEDDEPLDDAEFEVTDSDGDLVATGTSGDDGDGLFCVDNLVLGDEYTVEETAAPEGYEPDPDNPQDALVVDTESCETRISDLDEPDLTFVNALEAVTQATPTPTPTPTPTGQVGAATGTPAVQIPDTTAEGSGMWGALAPVLFTLILLGSLGANAYLHLQRARRRNA